MNLWACPNAKEFMRDICQLVRTNDQYACVIIPKNYVLDFAEQFINYSQNFLGDILRINIDAADNIESVFLDAAFPQSENPMSLHTALETAAENMYLLLVISPDLQDPLEKCREFFEHLAQLVKIRKDTCAETLLWRIIAVWPAHVMWPRAEVGLELRYWFSQIRQSDIEYVIERCWLEQGEQLKERELLWLYALCQGLATIDPMLSVDIFKNLPTSIDDIQAILEEHGLYNIDRDLRQKVIRMDSSASAKMSTALPPTRGDAYDLWSHGALDVRTNGFPALHPAAIHAANRINSLERMVVQGQMKVYLPIVQEVHTFICTQLQKDIGDTWNKKDEKYSSLNEDICALPRYMSEYLKGRHDPELYDLAIAWRNIRNCLAHSHMLGCADLLCAYKLYEKLRDRLK